MASFLYCSPYSYHSSTFAILMAITKSKGKPIALSPLRARKSDSYCYRDSRKSDNYAIVARARIIKMEIKERSKEIIPKMKKRKLRK